MKRKRRSLGQLSKKEGGILSSSLVMLWDYTVGAVLCTDGLSVCMAFLPGGSVAEQVSRSSSPVRGGCLPVFRGLFPKAL